MKKGNERNHFKKIGSLRREEMGKGTTLIYTFISFRTMSFPKRAHIFLMIEKRKQRRQQEAGTIKEKNQ